MVNVDGECACTPDGEACLYHMTVCHEMLQEIRRLRAELARARLQARADREFQTQNAKLRAENVRLASRLSKFVGVK